MRTFVMGDIHGAFKAFQQCLTRSGFNRDTDFLIQLGDIVDGYPEVYEVVEALLEIKHLVLIKGNHDQWFQMFYQTDYHPALWRYGGKATILSYLKHAGKPVQILSAGDGFKTSLTKKDIPASHKHLFDNQQLYFRDAYNRFFTHGGFDRHLPLSLQKESAFFWDRELFNAALEASQYQTKGIIPEGFYNNADFTEIFIGHTSTTKWQTDQPIQALNITNVDTGAGHHGRLTIMELPDGPPILPGLSTSYRFWQSDPLTELYTDNN